MGILCHKDRKGHKDFVNFAVFADATERVPPIADTCVRRS